MANFFSFDEVRQDHATYYLHQLARLDEVYKQGGPDVLIALQAFDEDWAELLAAWKWASDGFAEDIERARVCAALPHAGTNCLHHRLSPREYIDWLRTAIEAARSIKDRSLEGFHLGNLGIYFWRIGDHASAVRSYEAALEIDREVGSQRGEAVDYGNLGLALSGLGEIDRAIECYKKQLTLAREISDPWTECGALGNLGAEYYEIGDYELAMDYSEQNLILCQRIGNSPGEAHALDTIGTIQLAKGNTQSAISFFERSLVMMRDLGDSAGEAEVCWNLGRAHVLLGNISDAVSYMSVRVRYEREIEHADAETHGRQMAELLSKSTQSHK